MNPKSRNILFHQVEEVYSHQRTALLSNFFCSLILAYILRDQCDYYALASWLFLVFTLTSLPYFLSIRYWSDSTRQNNPKKWANLYSGGLFLSGLSWGSIALICFPNESIVHQIFLTFVLGGMVIGASAASSSLKFTFYLYSLPVLLPITIKFGSVPDEIHLTIASLLLLFLFFCAFLSGNIFSTSLARFRAQEEKEERTLELDNAEETLRQHQKSLEDQIRMRTAELNEINLFLKAEVRIRKQTEEKYRLLFEKCNDGIFAYISDEDLAPSQFIKVNAKASEMLGYSTDELLCLSPKDLVESKQHHKLPAVIENKRKSGGKIIFETKLVRKDGSILEVEINDHSFKNGESYYTLSTVRDISERKLLEKEVQKRENLQSLCTLASGFAHDFNNLLTAISGNIELARLTIKEPDKLEKSLSQASEALKRTSQLTRQLLTLSKEGEPTINTADIPEIIRNSASFTLSGSNIQCSYDIQENVWPAQVDAHQIQQVASHMVMNAKEATPEGGQISIKVRNETITKRHSLPLAEGQYVMFTVQDTGKGISKGDIHKIFDPYFSSKVRSNKKGLGLSLSICHSIIQRHNGHIAVSSEAGEGTIFAVYLPAMKSGTENSHPSPRNEKDADQPHVFKKILILEDEWAVAEIIVEMLGHLGHETVLASTGERTVQLYKDHQESGAPFDLAILDLTIRGGTGGKETAKKLLEIDPEAFLIISSGYTDDEVMSDFKKFGFKSAIEKPFTIQSLKETLGLAIK